MKLKALYLRNFRNYQEALFEFSDGINCIYGDNAQGKTNLLEAIYMLITGRSFRTPHMSDLIHFDNERFYIEARFVKHEIEQTLSMSVDEQGRKIVHNATPLPSLSTLLGILLGVILSPEDADLIKGGPASRRHFLDLQTAQTTPLYLHHLSRYAQAMRQRNFLLRRKQSDTLALWEEQMAHSAAIVTLHRQKTVDELLEQSQGHALDELQLSYHACCSARTQEGITAHLLKQYEKQRPREMDLGQTLCGPHKDDMEILTHGKKSRYFSSEGQKRSAITALRFAQWSRLKEITGETPLLCIDDIGISLDAKREEQILKKLTEMGQVFITTPRADLPLPESVHRISIETPVPEMGG